MPIEHAERKIDLPSSLVMALYENYNALGDACMSLQDSIRADADTYPVYVPTYGFDEEDHGSEAAREAAIKSITQLYVRTDGLLPEAGILCASSATVGHVEMLNKAKNSFKESVMSIRDFRNNEESASSRITKLIRDEITEKGYRTEQLSQAMGTVGIEALDLKRCYALTRIMPEHLDVFSWTWATTHSRIKKVSLADALEMAKKITDKKTSAIAVDILSRCNTGEMLALKTTLPNQLRANYGYWVDGAIVRKLCPISGVVIAQQRHMPRKLWRPNPGDQHTKRLVRESNIESAALVSSLDLYRYVK